MGRRLNDSRERQIGIIISYILIVVNTIYGLYITPYIISQLGDSSYGVYKTINSMSSSFLVLDLGIGSMMLRYVSKFCAEKDTKRLQNFIAMCFVQAGVLALGVAGVMACFLPFLSGLFDKGLTSEEIKLATRLFELLMVNVAMHIFENAMNGAITGCNRFTFANGAKLARIVLRMILIYVLLKIDSRAEIIILIDIVLTAIYLISEWIYLRASIHIKPHLYKWEKGLFKESFGYSILMFLQSIAGIFNSNLDNVVIAAYVGSIAVSVYSIGLQLYNMLEQFATSFSNVMLPAIMKKVVHGASNKELEDSVIKVGRLQFMMVGCAICGFAILGKDFIRLWLGESYLDAYSIALILMIPTSIPLIQNVCLSILRAKNKITFRTYAMIAMSIINLILTVILVKRIGYMGALIGTVIGLIAVNVIAMNIYYVKVIHLNIFRIFRYILRRTALSLVIASAVTIVASQFLHGSWITLIIDAVIFIAVFGICMIAFGFNKEERNALKKIIFKWRKAK